MATYWKNRWLQLGVGLLLVTCAVVVVLALLSPRSGVTQANYDRIETGMTRIEVQALFGIKADGEVYWGRGVHRKGEAEYWRNSDTRAEATILFDEHDRVVDTMWWPGSERSFLERLLDRLLMREEPPVIRGIDLY